MVNNEFIYSGDDVLAVMSKYAVNRNRGVERLISHYFNLSHPQHSVKLLEFGAGRGEFINRFLGKPNVTTYATDLDEYYYLNLQKHHRAYRLLTDVPEAVEYIFAIDVLEHIEDDVLIMRQMHERLVRGGKMLIYVPARPELYSAFDRKIGHFRRYRPGELRAKAMSAGFSIDVLKYHDFLGYFAAYYNKLLAGSNNGELNAGAVRLYDRWLVPLSNAIEKVLHKPFIGKDLLLVASK